MAKQKRKGRAPRTVPDYAPGAPIPVVAVGASAGGLEALSEFLKALPPRTGMAFVVIQHLAPQHQSALTQLLSKTTSMTVVEVSDGLAMRRNQVYVIPPDKSMTIQGRVLKLMPRERSSAPYHPIDEFASALAAEQKSAAIGVILSGSGSDGTLGLEAIRAEGGVTFAQDPRTAAWPAMPSSAIAAGTVDFVLPVAGIASELASISRHPYLLKHRAADQASEETGLEKIYALLRAGTDVDFRLYKQPTVSRRVARRMALKKMGSVLEYVRFLKQNADEVKALSDDIFIHVTGFFRDPECFQALRKLVFPKLHLNRRTGPVRVWVPGCSTGEEVWSLAMLLLESLGANAHQTKIQMFGTDISEPVIARARTAIYSESAMRGVSPARRRRFFVKVENGYQISKEVRALCVFARHNLANDPPFSRLDLISCRNVLIYAGPLLQNRILSAFQYALNPDGFLFLGKSESISAYADIFAVEDRNHKIFSRKPTAGLAPRFDWRVDDQEAPNLPPPKALTDLTADFRKQAEQLLLAQYAPPALAVDSDLRVLHLQGDTSRYLVLATGPPTDQLLKMLRPEFVMHVCRAVSKAKKERTTVATGPIQFQYAGERASVRLEISPMTKVGGGKADYLVVFREAAAPQLPGSATRAKSGKRENISNIERELAATREYLRSQIAEHESAQEQMKAANEEILSSSEELQSTNEELETAKEELLSTNEELQTLNEELLHRNFDLGVLTNDLNSVLVGADIPVVVLDNSLRIRRFTPMAGKLLNLIEADTGRPFSDIASTLEVGDWGALFAEVINQDRAIEREVKDKSGRWHSLRIRPYRAADNKIDGVIVVLLDTDTMKRQLEESHDYAHMLLESAQQAVVAASAGGTIVLVNRATETMFGYDRSELLGRPLDLLLPARIPPAVKPSGTEDIRRELLGRRKDGTQFPVEVSLSEIDQAGVKVTVAFMVDVTERQKLEIRALAAQLITAQEEERRRVSRDLHDSLCQKLASLAFDIENLAAALPGPAATKTSLRALRKRAIQVSEEARHIAYELHPSALDDLGLVVSLRALCDDFARTEGIKVDFGAGKLPESIPQQIASGLYRISQESLQNVAKHAKAKHLAMELAVHDHSLVLSIQDDGVGFVPRAVKGKGGLGLVSIGERARMLGGALSIESKPGDGTRISVAVPLATGC